MFPVKNRGETSQMPPNLGLPVWNMTCNLTVMCQVEYVPPRTHFHTSKTHIHILWISTWTKIQVGAEHFLGSFKQVEEIQASSQLD